jgi:hypothetical protein
MFNMGKPMTKLLYILDSNRLWFCDSKWCTVVLGPVGSKNKDLNLLAQRGA